MTISGFGGAEGSRTPDLLIANEALYQLSYDPTPKPAGTDSLGTEELPAQQISRRKCFRARRGPGMLTIRSTGIGKSF